METIFRKECGPDPSVVLIKDGPATFWCDFFTGGVDF